MIILASREVAVGEHARGHQGPPIYDEADPLRACVEPHCRPSILRIARFVIGVDVPPVRQGHREVHGNQDHHHVEPPALPVEAVDWTAAVTG